MNHLLFIQRNQSGIKRPKYSKRSPSIPGLIKLDQNYMTKKIAPALITSNLMAVQLADMDEFDIGNHLVPPFITPPKFLY